MINGDMLNQIEGVLSKHMSGCEIEVHSVTWLAPPTTNGGWLVYFSASDQERGWSVAFLTKSSDLDGYYKYKVRWEEAVG